MKSEMETVREYAAELKLLSFRDELEDALAMAAENNFGNLSLVLELLKRESLRRQENRKRPHRSHR